MQYLFITLFILGFIAFLGFLILMILSIRKGNRLPIRFIFLTTSCFAIASIGLYGMLNLSSNSTQSEIDQALEHESSDATTEKIQQLQPRLNFRAST